MNPAKVRVEIFREPGFFDDNWQKGWTKTSAGTSSFSTDGDVAHLDKGDQTECVIEKTFPGLSTTTYSKLVIRCTSTNEWFYVYGWYNSAWNLIYNGTDVGVFEASIEAGYTITKIKIRTGGVSSLDYVAIDENSLLVPDLGDLVEELTVTRPLLNNGIAGAKLSIPNFAGSYNGLIKNQDAIIIWLARDDANLGVLAYKVFGGKVVTSTNRGERYGAFYIDLDCHGHAYELNIPPALLQKYYAATNGRTIIEDALGLCNYFAQHPIATMWFDNAGSSGSTDDRINSTHDAVYDEELPMTVIQEILEKAKNPAAVQGFDAYETPAGCVIGHLRNSLDFVSPIASITPESYQKSEDWHRVRNKIKVYGCFNDNAQMPKDENWTESLLNWVAGKGTLSLTDSNEAGTYSILCSTTGTQTLFSRTLQPELMTASGLKRTTKNSFGKIHFYWLTNGTPVSNGASIVLQAPDTSNYFIQYLSGTSGSLTLTLGPDGGWTSSGSPNWDNIQKITLSVVSSVSNFGTLIDNLRLREGRFYALKEDSESQSVYGMRMDEPIVDDSLKSDAECQGRAESIIAVLKDLLITLSDVVVDGDHRYNPGDRQRIVVSNDGLDAYFRIIQVQHSVKGTQWNSVLTLSNEPQHVDYVFKLLQEAQKLLERRG